MLIPILLLAVAGMSPDEMRNERGRLLLRSKEQSKLGLHARAAATARTAVRLTEATDGRYSPAMAEALLRLVDTLLHADEYSEATAAAAWLIRVRERTGAAPWLVRDARNWALYAAQLAKMSPAGREQFRQSSLAFHEAEQLTHLRQYGRAATLFEKALAERLAVVGYADQYWIERQTDLAFSLLLAGKGPNAKRAMALALGKQRELLGEENRRTAIIVRRMALILQQIGELDEAAKLADYAAALSRATDGPGSENEKDALRYLASTRAAQAESAAKGHRYGTAAGHYLKAARAWKLVGGEDAWREKDALAWRKDMLLYSEGAMTRLAAAGKAADLQEQADALMKVGRFADAAPILGDAVRRIEAAGMLRHRGGLILLWELGEAELRSGRESLAERRLALCLRLAGEELSASSPFVTSRLDFLLRWWRFQMDARRDSDDLAGALRACEKYRAVQLARYPGQLWRDRTIEWEASHLRNLAKLPAEDRKRVMTAIGRLAGLKALQAKGEIAQASRLIDSVLTDLKLLPETDYYRVNALDWQCYFLLERGLFPEAEKSIRLTLALRELAHGKEHSLYAFTLQHLGTMYARTGNWEVARKAHAERAEILTRTLGRGSPRYSEALQALAVCHMALGRQDLARHDLEAALEILKEAKGGDRASLAQVLNTLGGLYNVDLPELAAQYFEQAADIWKKLEDTINHAIALDNLGGVYSRLGDAGRALVSRREALAVFRSRLGDLHPTTAVGLANVAQALDAHGDQAEAAKLLALSLAAERHNFAMTAPLRTELQQVASLRRYRLTLSPYLAVTSRAGVPALDAWEQLLAWKGLSLLHQRQARLARAAPSLKPFVQKLQASNKALAAVALGVPETRNADAWRRRVEQLTALRDEAERELAGAAAELPGAPPVRAATPAEVREAVPRDGVLLDFFVHGTDGPLRLGVFVIRRAGVTRLDLGSVERIAHAIGRWREARENEAQLVVPGRELARLMWLPLLPHIGDARTVLISPDGPVSQFPFAALPSGRRNACLVEEHSFVTVPVPSSLPVLSGKPPAPGKAPAVLLVGDVDFSGPAGKPGGTRGPGGLVPLNADGRPLVFRPLAATAEEMDAIAATYGKAFKGAEPKRLFKGGATEHAFRDVAPGKEVIHLATHGYFAPAHLRSALTPQDLPAHWKGPAPAVAHPGLLSGIALAGASRGPEMGGDDGILTAAELADLDLSAARLVVLSACDTGLGDTAGGEGVLGLQRALHVAGVRTAVTSLWQVNDSATKALMSEFYVNLWLKRMPPSEALREAQKAMIMGYDPARSMIVRGLGKPVPVISRGGGLPPYYWAGFVLSGGWK
jgi:CHAT domain-containing protein/tetratricopeptide (TPR) repeat protein